MKHKKTFKTWILKDGKIQLVVKNGWAVTTDDNITVYCYKKYDIIRRLSPWEVISPIHGLSVGVVHKLKDAEKLADKWRDYIVGNKPVNMPDGTHLLSAE